MIIRDQTGLHLCNNNNSNNNSNNNNTNQQFLDETKYDMKNNADRQHSSYRTKAESSNCFIIYLPVFRQPF